MSALPAAPLDDLTVFRAKCSAASERYAASKVTLLDAVDALQEHAVAYGIVAAIGQDAVQAIMADAFRPYRRAAK